MRIEGHTFLVTGGASGLGAAAVRRLAQDGANVIIADVDEETGEAWPPTSASRPASRAPT